MSQHMVFIHLACTTEEAVMFKARNIVNQILDEANTSVLKRQEINDRCDKWVYNLLMEWLTK